MVSEKVVVATKHWPMSQLQGTILNCIQPLPTYLPLILFVGLWHRLGHILPRQGIDGLALGGSYWSLMGRFHDGSQGLHHGIRTATNSQVQQRDAP